jgi:hypothetical protein
MLWGALFLGETSRCRCSPVALIVGGTGGRVRSAADMSSGFLAGVAPAPGGARTALCPAARAFERERFPALATRRDRLQRLKLTIDNEDRITPRLPRISAIDRRTRPASPSATSSRPRHAAHPRLKRWMKPVRVATPLHLQPDAPRSSVSRWAWSGDQPQIIRCSRTTPVSVHWLPATAFVEARS